MLELGERSGAAHRIRLPPAVQTSQSTYRGLQCAPGTPGGATAREHKLPDRTAFVGSHITWGHWILDYLPRIGVYNQLQDKDDRKIITGVLNNGQKQCLSCFGIDLNNIIELNTDTLSFNCYHGSDMALLMTPPPSVACDIVREGFVKTAQRINGPRYLYLSRRHLYPRHRVSNEEEVSAYLESKGFQIVIIDQLPFEDQINVMAGANIVVVPYGSDFMNLTMCNPNCVVVTLINRDLVEKWPEDQAEILIMKYLFSIGIPVVMAYGYPAVPGESITNSFDIPAHYDLKELDQALERAFSLKA